MTPNNYPFKDQISELIKDNGSAAVIARKIGISETTVGKWKKGDNDPSRENLLAICEAFEVNLLWLATGQGPQRGKDITHTPDSMGVIIRSTRKKYEKAVEELGYRPGLATEENIKSLIFSAEVKGTVDIELIMNLLISIEEQTKGI